MAKTVRVVSKTFGGLQYVWESCGGDTYSVSRDQDTLHGDIDVRGTKVVLFLKQDSLEFLEEQRLAVLLAKYCHELEPVVLLRKIRFGYPGL